MLKGSPWRAHALLDNMCDLCGARHFLQHNMGHSCMTLTTPVRLLFAYQWIPRSLEVQKTFLH